MAGTVVLQTGVAQAVKRGNKTAGTRPHVILIMTDQQRFDALGCASGGTVISPNLDRLAAEGHLFCNAYTSVPSSTPARAGLLTGMSPWHHGMLGYGQVAEHYEYELPQMLLDLGYHTLGIGKMHWHPQSALHGFEATLLDESGRTESPYFISDYRKWFKTHAMGLDPDSTGIGWNSHMAGYYALDEGLHPTVWTGSTAVDAIMGYSSDKPLFLKVSFARPHSPYDPPKRFVDMYEGRDIPAPAIGEWCEDMPVDLHPEKNHSAAKGNFGEDYARNSRKYYYASVTFVDEWVGHIIDALKEKGMYDNALVCFVSDHGDMMGDHNMWRKTYAYEGSSAIPFIVKLPESAADRLRKGSVVEAPVELRDLLPTFLDINDAAVPDAIDGMSLMPLFEEKNPMWRDYIDFEHATCYWKDNYWVALTDGRIKYIWFCHSGREQMFDLEKDPYEIHDVSGDASYSSEMDVMRQAMACHLSERGEGWVKDGRPVKREKSLLYSPNYPDPEKAGR